MDKETLSGNGGSEWTAIHVPFFCRKSIVYFPESEGVSGGVFEDVLGIGEVTRGAFVGIRKRVHLMPNLKGSPATDNCNRDIILKKVS